MERNTILAVVLSAAVFFIYQVLFVPPKPSHSKRSHTEAPSTVSPSGNNRTTELNTTTKYDHITSDYDIQSTKAGFLFSKMGGMLHKVDFLRSGPFPGSDVLDVVGYEDSLFDGTKNDNSSIDFNYVDSNIRIKKSYSFQNGNLINVRMEINNVSKISILSPSFKAFEIDDSNLGTHINSRETVLYEYSIYLKHRLIRKGNASKFSEKNNQHAEGQINWIGFRNRYDALIVKPEFKTKGYEVKEDNEKQLGLYIIPESKNIDPGQTESFEFSIYAGPQNIWTMRDYHKEFEKIVAFSNFTIIEWIAQGIYRIIPFLHNIFFKSWGIAIILVSLMIYGATYPLTMQSMMSMRKMQEVQPKIAALRDRYKNDPQKLNAEMIEIYRREKINPFGGCLPFLIQMPFFMALYQILWRAQYFQGHGFLWIKDLSQPDRLIIFPFYLPFFGNELNILPILTGCIMFLQQRISGKNIIITDEQQATQQKMMMYILPVMLTVMFYKFASSWAIYFLVYYILSTFTQWRISKLARK